MRSDEPSARPSFVTRSSGGDAWHALGADIRHSLLADGRQLTFAAVAPRMLFTTRLQSVVLLRLSQFLWNVLPPLAMVVKYLNLVLTGADISPEATIGPGLRLFHPNGVVIGPAVQIGANCTLMQHCSLGDASSGSPQLGDSVFVGAGAVIFGGLTVGDEAIISANAVVTRSVPADTMVGGVPARVLREPGWTPESKRPEVVDGPL